MASQVVHEAAGEDGFDLDAGAVTLEASTDTGERPGWLDADSVSPILGRDDALVARMLAIERDVAATLVHEAVARSTCGAIRRVVFAPPLRAARRALGDASLSLLDAAWLLAGPGDARAAAWPRLLAPEPPPGGDDDDECFGDGDKLLRCAAALLRLSHARDASFCRAFAAAGGRDALERLAADGEESGVRDDAAAALKVLEATLEFAALDRACDAAVEARAAEATAEPADASAAPPPDASAAPPAELPPADVGDGGALGAVLAAARLEAHADRFAAEKVELADLYDAFDADDLAPLLEECGLKAGERARLKRELARRRP